jgi:hypothetical protein
MAWRPSKTLLRRLAAITAVTRRNVDQRRALRERAEAARIIRRAALSQGIDPLAIRGLAAIAYMPNQLAALGITPQQDQADTEFIARDPVLVSHRGWAERIADRMPRFASEPPRGREASLDDWYAWALARQRSPADLAVSRGAEISRQAAPGRGTKWKRRIPGKLLDQALRRMRDAERRPFGFALFARASRAL